MFNGRICASFWPFFASLICHSTMVPNIHSHSPGYWMAAGWTFWTDLRKEQMTQNEDSIIAFLKDRMHVHSNQKGLSPSVTLSVSIHLYPSLSISIYLYLSLSLFLSLSLARWLSVSLPVCLSACLAGWLAVCLSISIYLYLSLSLSLSISIISICPVFVFPFLLFCSALFCLLFFSFLLMFFCICSFLVCSCLFFVVLSLHLKIPKSLSPSLSLLSFFCRMLSELPTIKNELLQITKLSLAPGIQAWNSEDLHQCLGGSSSSEYLRFRKMLKGWSGTFHYRCRPRDIAMF